MPELDCFKESASGTDSIINLQIGKATEMDCKESAFIQNAWQKNNRMGFEPGTDWSKIILFRLKNSFKDM